MFLVSSITDEFSSHFTNAKLLLSWVFPVFFKGRKRELVQDDLYQALESHKSNVLGDKLSNAWTNELRKCEENGKKPSLLKAILNVFGWQIMLLGLILACLEFFLR